MSQGKCIPYGSDVSAGTFKCADCGYELPIRSVTSLPPCPRIDQSSHPKRCWYALTGQGDSPNDPYPNR